MNAPDNKGGQSELIKKPSKNDPANNHFVSDHAGMIYREKRVFMVAHLREGGVEISVTDHENKQGPVRFYADEIPELIESLVQYYAKDVYGIEDGKIDLFSEDIEEWIHDLAKGYMEVGL